MMNKIKLNLHMLSDSSGETLMSIAEAVMTQFNDVNVKQYVWSFVSNKEKINEVVKHLSSYHTSFVIYTIIDDYLREYLKQHCRKLKIPCVPILSRVVREISSYLGIKPNASIRHYEVLSNDYYSRVDAMNYMLSHDDGQNMWELDEADIVLIGVSRTSKSPTSIYLAYRGYKVSNIPFIMGIDLPIDNFSDKLVVGLTIDPDRLIEIRRNRIMDIGNIIKNDNYVGRENVIKEIESAKKLFNKNKWPVIDVTRSSVEEIAARVLQYYYKIRVKNE
ncbi:MAG: kinase/pyrophosphorylase [Rickettsiaceae bacterium H1]|nr:kinase/pyrophosphorylase [Rickettsiaceae bacterium H1]